MSDNPAQIADTVAVLAEAWTRLVEDESGRPWRETSSGIITHAMLRCQKEAEQAAPHEHVYRCQDCGEIGRGPALTDGSECG